METPDWSAILERARHWVAFVGVRRLVTGTLSVLAATVVLWLLLRPSNPPIESAIATASETVIMPTASMSPHSAQVKVHVMGAVKSPGVYELSAGSRVVDAVRAAGGAIKSADLERINLAQTITDTEQVFVPSRSQRTTRITVAPRQRSNTTTISPSIPGSASTTQVPSADGVLNSGSKINLNSATTDQLDTLPGVGPSTAKAIIAYRTKSGSFKKVSDLMNVPGIGQAKFEAMRDLVTV